MQKLSPMDHQEFLLDLTKKCSEFFKQMHDHCEQFNKQLSNKKNKKNSTIRQKDESSPPKQKPKKKKGEQIGPKRPPSAYILYFQEQQKELHKLHPELPLTEITSMVGKNWTNLSDQAKVPFQKIAEKRNLEWIVELEQFKKDNPTLEINIPGQAKKKKSKKIAEKAVKKEETLQTFVSKRNVLESEDDEEDEDESRKIKDESNEESDSEDVVQKRMRI